MKVEERIACAEVAHREGRIIQNTWRRNGDDGREMVCALAAFGPDINSPRDCPADLMPQWLAELVPTLDDGIDAADVPWFSGELISRARRWGALDASAWERVRTGFQIACIRVAVEKAEAAQPSPRPDYWVKVAEACSQMISALQSNDLEKVKAARAAAWAAADAAAAARAAAARAAAWAAADAAAAARAAAARAAAADAAADAAAWAAADAAAAARAAAARAAADAAAARAAAAVYRQLVESLFTLIDGEL